MFLHGTTQWPFHHMIDVGANFCIWVLTVDGLRVAPFDLHPSGDESLQIRGLNADMWERWFTETVIGQHSPANPSLALIGTPLLQQRLRELWSQYLPTAQSWRNSLMHKHHPFGLSLEESKLLWNDLLPFQTKLSSLRIFYVDYPRVVAKTVPPVSVVLGLGDESRSSTDYRDQILRAARKLSRNP
jgi:hypothetical protein